MLESQTGPPPNNRKKSKCLVILILGRFRGGPVEGFMGGASPETFSGEAQLKKSERPVDALAVKKYQSLTYNSKSRDASASKNHTVY